ncbi:MAG: alkaline phosphatase [Firmicutes bacterium]|nr:alkaline phosphatase [Bacillota bacterium]
MNKFSNSKVSRLSIVVLLLVSAMLLMVFPSFAAEGQVKNVILLIGDGMGFGPTQYARNILVGPEGRLTFEKFPYVGLVSTYSANQWVTDSAAAATAMATGYKTNNEMIGVKPDGTPVKTVLEAAQQAGKAVGLISTNTIYDATPAAFGAHFAARSGSDAIAAQLVDHQIDVLLGGGSDRFLPKGVGPGKRADGKNLVDEVKAAGYVYVTNRSELASAAGSKLLGLFNPSYMNYQNDRDEVNSQEPSLAEMTSKALEVLSKDKDGFFLMSEGARIDHMAHTAEVAGVVSEIKDFEAAVDVAVKFAASRKDTLVVVTADHDTMGLSVTEPFKPEVIRQVKASPEYMALQMKKDQDGVLTAESIKQVFADFAGITDLTDAEIVIVQGTSKAAPYKQGYEIGSIIAAHANVGAISSAIRAQGRTGGHSGNQVAIYASGPAGQAFAHVLDNTDIARILAQVMGLNL